MKKFFFLMMLTAVITSASAQEAASVQEKFRLNVYTNYVFDDGFDSYYDPYNYYNGTMKGGFQWGVGAEFLLRKDYSLELMYLHQSTEAPTQYQSGTGVLVKNTTFDVNIDYIMLGGNRYVQRPGSKAEPFGGLFVGVGILNVDNPDNGNQSSATKFAWGARLGCNIWASDRFGLKLQAQLLSIAQGAGGGLYFGTGGVGAGVSTYSSVYQFVLGGGITFKMGQ
ncbi:MAG TPA: outer membrane beta-barrel protein [Chitinophagaceae bacterium]